MTHEDEELLTSRRKAMAVLAAAKATELQQAVASLRDLGAIEDLKPPEIGLVMLRGRIGGNGTAFNVGEATVARAIVQLPSGEIGYGIRLGRDLHAARNAAILDALWQAPASRPQMAATVLSPISRRLAADRARMSAEAAASRVDFFTLAREAT